MRAIELIIIIIVVVSVLAIGFLVISERRKNKQSAEYEAEEKSKAERVLAKTSKGQEPTNEFGMTNYNYYKYSLHEFIIIALIACSIFFGIGFVFYQNVIVAGIIALAGLYYPKIYKKKKIIKRKAELSRQFQQALFSLSSALVAGRSIENAFKEVTNDLYLLYPGKDTMIIQEFEHINQKLDNRETVESALEDFSERAGIEDISNFTDVFVTCKRTGGDLVEVIRRTANMISEKFEIKQEISVMVAQKRFEFNALLVAPIGIISLLTYSSRDYVEPLFQWSHFGPVIMTFCLGILILSFWICQRIMDIEV